MSRNDSPPLGFDPDDFAAYYTFSPAALALRESVRLAAVRDLELEEPILDVGCGDGLFAQLAYPAKQVWGIDINPSEVKRAQATSSYQTLICGNVCEVALPQGFFGGAIANCSLEHVPALPEALANIRTSLKTGADFILIVPTPDWTHQLSMAEGLRKLGFSNLAAAYGDALDRVFNHVHLHDDSWWSDRLADAGFETVSVRGIVLRPTSWLFEMLLPPSLLGFMVKKLTGRWVVTKAARVAMSDLVRHAVQRVHSHLPDGDESTAGEYLIVARAVDTSDER